MAHAVRWLYSCQANQVYREFALLLAAVLLRRRVLDSPFGRIEETVGRNRTREGFSAARRRRRRRRAAFPPLSRARESSHRGASAIKHVSQAGGGQFYDGDKSEEILLFMFHVPSAASRF